MVANGDGPRDHPAIKHLKLPPLGHASRGALVITRTLLFSPDGDQITTRTPPGGGGRNLRALDKATGATTEVEVTVNKDECNRPDTTIEGLQKLRPVFNPAGSVGAG